MKHKRTYVYTIKVTDVGMYRVFYVPCKYCGRRQAINTHDIMGPIQQLDIGKRIYRIGSGPTAYYAVENQEQLIARKSANL